jgi:hypothetical protein
VSGVVQDWRELPATGERARARREEMKNQSYAELCAWAGLVAESGWTFALSRRLGVGMAWRGGSVLWLHAARWRTGRAVGESWDSLVRLDVDEDFRRVAARLVSEREFVGRDSRAQAEEWVLSGLVGLASKVAEKRRRESEAGVGV